MTKKIKTVNDLIRDWWGIHCQNLAKSTLCGYQMYINAHIIPKIGNMNIINIKQYDIQNFINYIAALGRSTKTQKNMTGLLHSIFEYAVINGLITTNPVSQIVKSKTAPYEYYIYSQKEYDRLVKLFENSRDLIPVLIGGVCGLRLSEVFGLKWSDIDFKKNTLQIKRVAVSIGGKTVNIKPTAKTEAGNRLISVPKHILDKIKPFQNDFNNWIFPSNKNPQEPENSHNFYRRYARKIKKEGLPHTRFHDLRHFAATNFLDAGVPDKYAAAYLGHVDTNMTRKYQHIRQQIIPYPIPLPQKETAKRE